MTLRDIKDHKVNTCNAAIEISVVDDQPRNYVVTYGSRTLCLQFHEGDPALGVNGLTVEALLAIAVDRLRYYQREMPCRENACAITKIEEAQMWLLKRTREREERGVEGKKVP